MLQSCQTSKVYRMPELSYIPLLTEGEVVEINGNVNGAGVSSMSMFIKFPKSIFVGGQYSGTRTKEPKQFAIGDGLIWSSPKVYSSIQNIASASIGFGNLFNQNIVLMGTYGQRKNTTAVAGGFRDSLETFRFKRYSMTLYHNFHFKSNGLQYGFMAIRDFTTFVKSKISPLRFYEGETIDSFMPFVKLNAGFKHITFNIALFYEFGRKLLEIESGLQVSTGLSVRF